MGLSLKNMELYKEPEELYTELCRTLKENGTEYNPEKLRTIYETAALVHQGEKRYSGEEYVTHPLNAAIILADMGADEETVCAGLLHDVMGHEQEMAGLSVEIGADILDVLCSYQEFIKTGSCADDRGALVALADRLHNMRTIEFVDPSTWKQRAEETLKIFSPLAAKYPDIRLRSELDDLSFKHLLI